MKKKNRISSIKPHTLPNNHHFYHHLKVNKNTGIKDDDDDDEKVATAIAPFGNRNFFTNKYTRKKFRFRFLIVVNFGP